MHKMFLVAAFFLGFVFPVHGQRAEAVRYVRFGIEIGQVDFLKKNRPDVVRHHYWISNAIEDVRLNAIDDAIDLLKQRDGLSVEQQLIQRQILKNERQSRTSIIDQILKHNDWSILDKQIEDFVHEQMPQDKNSSSSVQTDLTTCWRCIVFESYLTLGILTALRFDELRPISLAGWRDGIFHLDNFWRDGNRNATNYWDLKSVFRGHMPMGVVAQEIFGQNDPKTLKAITERIGWNSDYRTAKFEQWLFSVDYAVAFEWGVLFVPVRVRGRWILIPLPNPFNESFAGGVGSKGLNKQGKKNKHGLVDILGGTSTFAILLSVGFDAADRWFVRPYLFRKYESSRWRYFTYPLGALAIFPKSFARVAAFHSPFDRRYH